MKILFDTSVLVAALVEKHSQNVSAFAWLQKVKEKIVIGVVATHSIAELYNVLTTLPIRPRISPTAAIQAIRRDVLEHFQIVELNSGDYLDVIQQLAELGILGGATFDALAMRAAMKANVDQVITLNAKDFRRVSPSLADKVVSP